jgi:hypothetical protein
MIRAIILSTCLAASSLSLSARAQDERSYTEGPVTEQPKLDVGGGETEKPAFLSINPKGKLPTLEGFTPRVPVAQD